MRALREDWRDQLSSAAIPSSGLMKAAVMIAPRQVAIHEIEVPLPGPDEVRVRLEGCGVCASNVTPWEGPQWMTFPTRPGGLGHEGWGVVDALGAGVTSLLPGDRVATLFANSFAQYDVGKAEAVVKLPGSLARKPFPGEPLACAMNIMKRSGIEPGGFVAVIGIGFLGSVLTQLASHAGARVIAISRRQASLELAREMGAAATIPMTDTGSIIASVREMTGATMCDRVIEATGKQGPLDLAGELVREGGRLIIAGYHQDGPRHINMQQWNWKGIDVVNAHERDPAVYVQGIKDAIVACADGHLVTERLYTHYYPLTELGAALQATRDHPEGFVKALVMMP